MELEEMWGRKLVMWIEAKLVKSASPEFERDKMFQASSAVTG